MKKLSEREEGRLVVEIKRLNKELEDLKDKRNLFEVSYNRLSYKYIGMLTHC